MPGPSETLLRAVAGIVAERGLDAVSVRQVAERAGVSIGAVQHHFPTKDALLLAAVEHVSTAFRADLERRLDGCPSYAEALRILLLRLVGAEPDDRASTAVWLAFTARAAVDPGIAAVHRREWADLEETLTDLLRAAAPERPDPADDAAELLALADGLAIAVALEPGRMPPERAERLLAGRLALVLPG